MKTAQSELTGNNASNKLTLESAGAVTDTDDAKIVINDELKITSMSSIVLADDANANGTGTGSATDVLTAGGNVQLNGTSIMIGQDGQTAGSATDGANVEFSRLILIQLAP